MMTVCEVLSKLLKNKSLGLKVNESMPSAKTFKTAASVRLPA